MDGFSSMLDGTLILDKFPQSRVVLQGDFKPNPTSLLWPQDNEKNYLMTETFLPVVQHDCINFNKVQPQVLVRKKHAISSSLSKWHSWEEDLKTIDPYINRNKSRTMYIPVFNFNPLFFRSELSRFSETWAYFFCERRPELSKSPCTFAWLCPWIKKWDCFSEKNSPLVDSLLAVDPSWILTTSDN